MRLLVCFILLLSLVDSSRSPCAAQEALVFGKDYYLHPEPIEPRKGTDLSKAVEPSDELSKKLDSEIKAGFLKMYPKSAARPDATTGTIYFRIRNGRISESDFLTSGAKGMRTRMAFMSAAVRFIQNFKSNLMPLIAIKEAREAGKEFVLRKVTITGYGFDLPPPKAMSNSLPLAKTFSKKISK